MKYSKELKIGIVVIVCAGLLVFGFNFLKGVNIFKPTNFFRINFPKPLDKIFTKEYNTPNKSDERKPSRPL